MNESKPVDLEAIRLAVHLNCEDAWYSCPKSSEGCSDDHAGKECNCGADRVNEIIVALKAEVESLRFAYDGAVKGLLNWSESFQCLIPEDARKSVDDKFDSLREQLGTACKVITTARNHLNWDSPSGYEAAYHCVNDYIKKNETTKGASHEH